MANFLFSFLCLWYALSTDLGSVFLFLWVGNPTTRTSIFFLSFFIFYFNEEIVQSSYTSLCLWHNAGHHLRGLILFLSVSKHQEGFLSCLMRSVLWVKKQVQIFIFLPPGILLPIQFLKNKIRYFFSCFKHIFCKKSKFLNTATKIHWMWFLSIFPDSSFVSFPFFSHSRHI